MHRSGLLAFIGLAPVVGVAAALPRAERPRILINAWGFEIEINRDGLQLRVAAFGRTYATFRDFAGLGLTATDWDEDRMKQHNCTDTPGLTHGGTPAMLERTLAASYFVMMSNG